MEFEEEENTSGQKVENSYLRRLIQILQMPSSSLASSTKKGEVKEAFFKSMFAPVDTSDIDSRGFQSICRKCIHFNNARFRDLLMEISLLSQENTIGMFVENLSDLSILFE